MKYQQHVSIEKLTSFKQHGVIQQLYICESLDDIKNCFSHFERFHILGKGSNSLVKESAYSFPFVQLSSQFSDLQYKDGVVIANAGVSVNQLISFSLKHGLTAFEFMAGVPATVGGMVAMNFGCWNVEIADRLAFVDVLHPVHGYKRLIAQECEFAYRSSVFQREPYFIVQAAFNVQPEDAVIVKQRVKDYVQQRVVKQPIRGLTFGSVFKNPKQHYAAQLIEECGLKGQVHHRVEISKQHANFFVNHEGATCEDVEAVISFIQQQVYAKFNINLEPEVTLFNG